MIHQIFTIPNMLSIVRILLTPLIIIFLFPKNTYSLIALCLFILAAITDFFDGYFARTYNMKTELGKFLDPLADKILVLTTFVAFYYLDMIEIWMVIVIFLRDIIVTILRSILLKHGFSLATSHLAKWKTATQFIAIYLLFSFVLLHSIAEQPIAAALLAFCEKMYVLTITLYSVVFLTVWSGIDYFVANRTALMLLITRGKKESLL